MQFCNGTDSQSVHVLLALLDSKVTFEKPLSFEATGGITFDTLHNI